MLGHGEKNIKHKNVMDNDSCQYRAIDKINKSISVYF